MRKIRIIPNEYYHIYNRGNNKQNIFLEEKDFIRFLFLILYFQLPINFSQINRIVSYYIRDKSFNRIFKQKTGLEKTIKDRYVELISFTFMPNHFHFIIREMTKGGISRYMQRVLDAYTKYFNTKYEKSGHLFQGPYQVVHIENNEQLLYLSAYIHLNQREIAKWKNKELLYPWSSYQDYIKSNRWGKLLNPQIILKQFSAVNEYKDFVINSVVKSKEMGLEEKLKLD